MSAIHFVAAGVVAGQFAPKLSLANVSVGSGRDTSGGPGTATSIYQITNAGQSQEITNISTGSDSLGPATDVNASDWWTGKPDAGIGDSYEARWNLVSSQAGNSETFNTPFAENVWTTINVTHDWELLDSGNNIEVSPPAQRVFTLEIGEVGTSTALVTATITLTASLFGP